MTNYLKIIIQKHKYYPKSYLKIETKPWGLFQDVDEKLLYDTFSAFGLIVTNHKVINFPMNPITHLWFCLS